jgi:hypothetical protein
LRGASDGSKFFISGTSIVATHMQVFLITVDRYNLAFIGQALGFATRSGPAGGHRQILQNIRYRTFAKSGNTRRSPMWMTTLKAAAARSQSSTASNPSSRPSPGNPEREAVAVGNGSPTLPPNWCHPTKSGSWYATSGELKRARSAVKVAVAAAAELTDKIEKTRLPAGDV